MTGKKNEIIKAFKSKTSIKLMKILLYYYNDLTVFLATIFKNLGFTIDYVGKPKKEIYELGVKNSPESWCFDMKLILGQCLYGVKRKDDIITVPGAWGGSNENCLLGHLTQGIFEKKIEKITGKNPKIWFFNINAKEIIMSGYTAVYNNLYQLCKYSKVKNFRTVLIKSIFQGIRKMKLASKLKETILDSPEIINKHKLFEIYENFIQEAVKANSDINTLYEKSINKINSMERIKIQKKIKIGIVGDFSFTLFSISPFFDIEKFLLMNNVSVIQPLSFYNYYNLFSPLYLKENRKRADKLIPQKVSGSDVVTILSSLSIKNKVNGLIHIKSFGCTPEEVAGEILAMNKKEFPKILNLSYDAHTTEENLKVRIEAFIDMLNK